MNDPATATLWWSGGATAGGLAIALTWLTGDTSPLMAAIVLLALQGGRGAILQPVGLALAALAVLMAAAPDRFSDPRLQFTTFAAAALAVGGAFAIAIRRRAAEDAAQSATRMHEQEAHLIIESIPSLAWSIDPEGKFRYCNQAIYDYTGWPRGNDPGFGGAEVLHPDEVEANTALLRHSLQTGAPHESVHRLRRHDGAWRWFRAVGRPRRDAEGRITGLYGSTLDIDDLKRAESALRAREQELKTILDSMPGMVSSADAEGQHLFANRRVYDYIYGEQAEPVCYAWADVVHPDDLPKMLAQRRHALETGQPYEGTFRLRRIDGQYRWFHVRTQPARDGNGRIVRWYSLQVDVHEHKLAQEDLKRSEQQQRLLIETIPGLVWSVNPRGKAIYLNKRLLDYTGLTFGEGLRSRRKLIHPADMASLRREWSAAIAESRPFYIIIRLRRADGVYRWHESRAEALRDDAGTIVQWYGVTADIDDRLRTEQALRTVQSNFQRAAQLASLAELSASIAHEVNQPLGAVAVHGHACRRWLSADPPNLQRARLTVERIIGAATSAGEVVNRVRALFQRSTNSRSAVDLRQVVAEVCEFMTDDIVARDITIETDLDRDLPTVQADRVQLQQVLVNLVRNGIESMDTTAYPRTLSIAAGTDSEGRVTLEIRDRGVGIPDAERIFEPFFTTKTDGMGMGLAICRSIVEAHDGKLWAVKAEPQGTRLILALPAATQ